VIFDHPYNVWFGVCGCLEERFRRLGRSVLGLDIHAATAALTMPQHNGRTEGVNTKTKMIKRQM
jgi:transposase